MFMYTEQPFINNVSEKKIVSCYVLMCGYNPLLIIEHISSFLMKNILEIFQIAHSSPLNHVSGHS